MTVPTHPTFDDYEFDLFDIDGTAANTSLKTGILDFEMTILSGATAPKMESFRLSVRFGSAIASQLKRDTLQLIRVVPYGLAAYAMWGVIGKIRKAYDRERFEDVIEVLGVGTEYLLKCREVYYYNGATVENIGIVAGKPDDLAKRIVRYTMLSGTCGNDAEGQPRAWNWGTLAVQADTAECPDVITFNIGEGNVWAAVDALAITYGFDYELLPSISGGAITFTFSTKYPCGGTDRTEDSSTPVIINDFCQNAMPRAETYREMYGLINALHYSGYMSVSEDLASIAAWGRWENRCGADNDTEGEIIRGLCGVKTGSTFEIDLDNQPQMQLFDDWFPGDLVTRNNILLGISASDEKVGAVILSFPKKALHIAIRWGDKEPTLTKKAGGGGGAGGGGRWRPGTDISKIITYAVPSITFAAAAAEGALQKVIRSDAVLKLIFKTDSGDASPSINTLTLTAAGGIAISAAADTITITGAGNTGFAVPALTFGAAHTEGAATTVIRSDAVLKLVFAGNSGTAVPSALNTITFTGAGGINIVADTNTLTLTGSGVTGFAAPAITFGAAHAEGAATTVIRSDAVLKLVFAGDAGTAIPDAANILTVAGGTAIGVTAADNTLTIAVDATAISHSDLDDLDVDDHTQYHDDARHAALAAVVTTHLGRAGVGAGAPGAPYAGIMWLDTSSTPTPAAHPNDVWLFM